MEANLATRLPPILIIAVLAGCAGTVGEKRHTPAEIAAYRPADFIAPLASIEGERVAVAERLERIRAAMLATPAATAVLLICILFQF